MFLSIGTDEFIKVLISIAVGGLIGLEREFRDKDAGFRTLIFICLGSSIFTILSVRMAGMTNVGDAGRIAAGIVSGVGFLGAGVILREGTRIKGLTTAASIWLTAALGVGIGVGEYLLSFLAALLALVVLELFPLLEIAVSRIRYLRSYELTCTLRLEKVLELQALFQKNNLRIRSTHKYKKDGNLFCIINASGSPGSHNALIESLFDDPEVVKFDY